MHPPSNITPEFDVWRLAVRSHNLEKMYSILSLSSWHNLLSLGILGSSVLVMQTKTLRMREGRCPAFGFWTLRAGRWKMPAGSEHEDPFALVS
jgi:hypothetical protein